MTTCRPMAAGWRCDRNEGHYGYCQPRRIIETGEIAQLGPQRLWWLARATSLDGRYALLTTVVPGGEDEDGGTDFALYGSQVFAVAYTLIDHELAIRGAVDVIGGGLAIDTVCGPDENVTKGLRMVTEDGFEVSHRNQVYLQIFGVQAAC